MKLVTRVENIGPAKAESYLKTMAANRKLWADTVVKYARDMTRGCWRLNGDSIRFDEEGALVDGQHRLHAVISSGVTISTLVVRGIPVGANVVMDDGRKRRPGDYLQIMGVPNANSMSAALVLVFKTFCGTLWNMSGRSHPTRSELLALHADIGDELAELVQESYTCGHHVCPPAIVAALTFMFRQVNRPLADAWKDGLLSGANLKVDSPILLLRSRLVARHVLEGSNKKLLTRLETIAICIRAWNLLFNDKTARSLVANIGRRGGSGGWPNIAGLNLEMGPHISSVLKDRLVEEAVDNDPGELSENDELALDIAEAALDG
jgi:hypothetical protein